MKKTLLTLSAIACLTVTSANAQRGADPLAADAQRLAAEVQRESRNLTREQAAQIQSKFSEIRDILYRTVTPQFSNYSCVARDNDNSHPWIYAVRDGINMIRIPSMAFNSLDNCMASITSIKSVGAASVACVSRDGDDSHPWVLATLNGSAAATKLAKTYTSTLADCNQLMNRMIVNHANSSVAYCNARDGDSSHPYVAYSLNLITGTTQQGSELFDDLNACWNFLGN